ncbi:hypothetical protein DU002_03900 [Corallincola holothuriorum]|uniref:Uncharacterized protein n=1 Tax=Corallincola holothuriorum TaxID=2282215 RepID=A0A368NP12_9GAMM|nr:hypothetical protein DU002_03900 [Corallincola holothuriorum]
MEWRREYVIQRYEQLAKSLRVCQPISFDGVSKTSPSVSSKHALWAISHAVAKGDEAAIKIAKQFVLADVYFHYSGFIRATMARRLKSANLSLHDREELREGLYKLFYSGQFGPEYKEFCRLLRRIGLGHMKEKYKELGNMGGKQVKLLNYLTAAT